MEYFVLANDGQEYGPATIDTIRQWIAEGRVEGSTRLRNAEDGSTLFASTVDGLWGASPASVPYSAPIQAPAGSGEANGYLIWSVIDSVLGIVMFFALHGVGLVFCGFGVYNAIRAVTLGSKFGWAALAIALISLTVVGVGWLSRSGTASG